MKQTKQLINWAEMPIDVIVDTIGIGGPPRYGKLLSIFTEFNSARAGVLVGNTSFDIYQADNLRLAPADQQPWLLYEEGVTVIPKWAEVSYLYTCIEYETVYLHEDDGGSTTRATLENKQSDSLVCLGLAKVYAFKLGDAQGSLFKEGYTDNPNEVTV